MCYIEVEVRVGLDVYVDVYVDDLDDLSTCASLWIQTEKEDLDLFERIVTHFALANFATNII